MLYAMRNVATHIPTVLQGMNKPSGSDALDETTTPNRKSGPSGPKRRSSSTGFIDNKTK